MAGFGTRSQGRCRLVELLRSSRMPEMGALTCLNQRNASQYSGWTLQAWNRAATLQLDRR